MDDRAFDERLKRRLETLDAGVPPRSDSLLRPPPTHRMRARGGSLGLLTAAAIIVLGALALNGWQRQAGAAPGTKSGSIIVTDAQARRVTGVEDSLLVTATIVNTGSNDDWIEGASSPMAKRVTLAGKCQCATPEPTDPETGIAGIVKQASLPIPAGETTNLAGGGAVVLFGLDAPVTKGQEITLTLRFHFAGAIAITAKVVST